jgi:muramoyltetrapeptide carboxypeptidase
MLSPFLIMTIPFAAQTSLETVKPPALRRGDTVGLTAPAGPLSAEQIRKAVENLKSRGVNVKLAADPKEKQGYLAADDDARAADLNRLVRDPEVKAIICLRGGYGSPRILDLIDYAAIRSQPKIIVGYSDITALLNAVRQHAGVVTFHGPMGREWATGKGPTPFSEKYLWPIFRPRSALMDDWGGARPSGMKAPTTLVGGRAEGILVGGNLSLISSLMGTPFELDTRDAVLFIEEVAEKPFRIDRMLNQLRLAGKLKAVRGVLLGGFPGCEARDPEGDFSPEELFVSYFGGLGVPVLGEYPAGHVPDGVTLPIGARVRLDATAKTLTILESAVEGGDEDGAEQSPGPR